MRVVICGKLNLENSTSCLKVEHSDSFDSTWKWIFKCSSESWSSQRLRSSMFKERCYRTSVFWGINVFKGEECRWELEVRHHPRFLDITCSLCLTALLCFLLRFLVK
uniref:Ovule protein n=1 Tax=Syphacia muris TaxID=451379 RepID=A0A0N5AE16_9BILA